MDYSLNPRDSDGYQPGGRAWDPFRSDVPALLESGHHAAMQPVYYGSNHTFLVTVDAGTEGRSFAIYKPARGEYPLYDFPTGTLYKREVATWYLSSIAGWELVPPTVVAHGRFGVGSVQLFIESVSEGEVEVAELERVALLDVLANNADRKAEHCLIAESGKLWGIDHGLTFHAQPKLRTVLWHFAGQPISDEEIAQLRTLHGALKQCREPRVQKLSELLSRTEWRALISRAEYLLDTGKFPNPRYKPIPYRW